MTAIIRVQDKQGRGPWRPGLSRLWVRETPDDSLLPIYADISGFSELTARAYKDGLHFGCATRLANFDRWFSADEMRRLRALGFRAYDASGCTILAETKTQLLIGWHIPLSCLAKFKFEQVAA